MELTLTEDTKNIEQIRAEVGMVFQQFNLFPHLSILDNCTLAPIWVKKMPKKEAEELALKHLRKSSNIRSGTKISWSIIWRSTTKSCYCSSFMYGAKNNAF